MEFINNIDWIFLVQAGIVISFAISFNNLLKNNYRKILNKSDALNQKHSITQNLLIKLSNIFSKGNNFLFYIISIIIGILFLFGGVVLFILVEGAIDGFDKFLNNKSWWIQILSWLGLIVFILIFKYELTKEKIKEIQDEED